MILRVSSLVEVHCRIVTRSVPFRAMYRPWYKFGFILKSKFANKCKRLVSYDQNDKSALLSRSSASGQTTSRQPLLNGGPPVSAMGVTSDRRPPAKKNDLSLRRREKEREEGAARPVHDRCVINKW
jgi:hypothetical protein